MLELHAGASLGADLEDRLDHLPILIRATQIRSDPVPTWRESAVEQDEKDDEACAIIADCHAYLASGHNLPRAVPAIDDG